jgi:hypothetical protein
MYSSDSITVITFPERADIFRSVVGSKADFKLKPTVTVPLDEFLTMVSINHGKLVIIDEAHFVNTNDFKDGIKRYVDNPSNTNKSLRLIFVCANRKPGDELLSFLSAYCSFYDIIYNTEGSDISLKLKHLINNPNSRVDILELIEPMFNKENKFVENKDNKTSATTESEICKKSENKHVIANSDEIPISICQSASKDENGVTVDIKIHFSS